MMAEGMSPGGGQEGGENQAVLDSAGDRRTVRFEGCGARSGPLTWSQQWSWDILRELTPDEQRLNLSLCAPIENGQTVDELVTMLGTLVSAHETLRTTFRVTAKGEPEQVVHGEGHVPVTVREAADENPSDAADTLRDLLSARRFDIEREVPLRVGISTRAEVPEYLVMVFANLALDGWGLVMFGSEVRARLAGEAPEHVAPAVQPLDQSAYETSQRGHAVATASARYWAGELELIRALPEPVWRPAGEEPRFWCGVFRSTALARAAQVLAARWNVPASGVLLAGLVALLGLRKGLPGCGPLVVTSNRHRPGLRSAYGRFAQGAPVFLDLQHETFAELVRAASLGLVRAAKFGQADPREVARLVHGDGEHRGAHLAFPVVFDYYHQEPPADRAAETDISALRRVATRSTFGWLDTAERENLHLYVKVRQFTEEAEIVFWIDTCYVSRADLAGIAWGTERLIIEAVAGTIKTASISAVTGVPEARWA
jgi:hypothetical protein